MTEKQFPKLALVNGRIILPREIVTGMALLIEGPKIIGLYKLSEIESRFEEVDVGNRYLSPGLIDIHIHGAKSHSFNEANSEAFEAITMETIKHGVTSLLATTVTAPISDLVSCLEFTRCWMNTAHQGTQVLGIHLEGPYLCKTQSGAQDITSIRNPDDGTPSILLEQHDIIKILTYAPELPGAIDLTKQLTQLNILPSAGHSCAYEEDILKAINAGLSHAAHIWSGQSTTKRDGPWRKPGLLEVSLANKSITVEMIADNKHLPPTLMKLAYYCVGPERLCVISDATSGAGLPDNSKFRMGGVEYLVQDNVGMTLDKSAFAGSTTFLNQMIPILTNHVHIPLVEVIRMMSLNPARAIKIDHRKGSLEPGKDADIAIFNSDFTCWRAMISGKWMYIN